MWPFNKRRWLVFRIDNGGYYAGIQPGTDSVWTPTKEKAMRFHSESEAYDVRQKLIGMGIRVVHIRE